MERRGEQILPPFVKISIEREDNNQVILPKDVPGKRHLRIETTIRNGKMRDEYALCDVHKGLIHSDAFTAVYLYDSSKERLMEEGEKIKPQCFSTPQINTLYSPDGKGGQIQSYVLFAVIHNVKPMVLSPTTTDY